MGLLTGFIEGNVIYQDNGTPKLLPFADKTEEASFIYKGENLIVETFSQAGIKGASAACPYREEAMFELSTSNITFAYLQAATGQLASERTAAIPVTNSYVLSTVSGSDSTLVLPETPVTGTAIVVANEEGLQYAVTASSATLTFDDDYTGEKVTVSYFKAAAAGQKEIALGKAERTGEFSLYGRFFGCPDTYLIYAKRVIVQPNIDARVGSNPAKVGMTLQCLRDDDGAFAYVMPLAA